MDELRLRLVEAAAELNGTGGIEAMSGSADPPWCGLEPRAAFHAGYIEGAAAALNLTVLELFAELGLLQ